MVQPANKRFVTEATLPELARDVIGATLQQGPGVQITVDDAGDRITIGTTSGSAVTKDGLPLTPVDGGPEYMRRFTAPMRTDPYYFPIGTWLDYTDATKTPSDAAIGINLYVGLSDPSTTDLSLLAGSGIQALLGADWWPSYDSWKNNPDVVGYVLADEKDMQYNGAGGDQSQGLADMQALLDQMPKDGRFAFANWGKGVAFYGSDYSSARYVNEFTDVSCLDIYWITDPGTWSQYQGGKLVNGATAALTQAQGQLGYNYALSLNTLRSRLQAPRSKPMWNFVELGRITGNDADPKPTVAQIKSAVLHSLMGGARGIVYFNLEFNGNGVNDYNILRDQTDIRTGVTAINTLVRKLAPVLNAPSVTGFATTPAAVATMTKYQGAAYYLFAGSKQAGSQSATFTLAVPGYTTVEVVDENRTIPITGTTFTDTFADQNAVHIYKIVR